MSWTASIVLLLSRFFVIGCRVLAFAYFASVFKYWLFIVVGVHFALSFICIKYQKTEFCNVHERKRAIPEFLYNLVMSWVYIFIFMPVVGGRTVYKYIIYFFVVYIENAVMTYLAYLYNTSHQWYHNLILTFVLSAFFIGMLLQFLYYSKLHPSKDKRNETMSCFLCTSCLSGKTEQTSKPLERKNVSGPDEHSNIETNV